MDNVTEINGRILKLIDQQKMNQTFPLRYYKSMAEEISDDGLLIMQIIMKMGDCDDTIKKLKRNAKNYQILVCNYALKFLFEQCHFTFFKSIFDGMNKSLDEEKHFHYWSVGVKLDTSQIEFYQQANPKIGSTTYALIMLQNDRNTVYLAGWSDHPDGIWARQKDLFLNSKSMTIIGENNISPETTIKIRGGGDSAYYQQVN